MHVIPAIDLLDGKVVRLEKGKYDNVTVYNQDPVQEARKFRDAGFEHIHIIDLNGAREGSFVNLSYIKKIADETGLSIQSGGGVRSYDDARQLLKQGISRVICSSMAVKKPEQWLRLVGETPEGAILGMDLKDGKVAYGGWLETSEQPVDAFLEPMLEKGLQYVLCTDISRDGTLQGPNIELYRLLKKQFPGVRFIASGGVSSADDLRQLQQLGIYGVVVGKAYYEGKLTLEEMMDCHRPVE